MTAYFNPLLFETEKSPGLDTRILETKSESARVGSIFRKSMKWNQIR